jgi:riboflavin synthase
MFTGIVEEIGTVRAIHKRSRGAACTIGARVVLGDLKPGDSVCLSGVCVTAVSVSGAAFTCDLSEETMSRTRIKSLRPGVPVNLERAVQPGSRMGGHLVLGHVDGVGEIRVLGRANEGAELEVSFPPELAPFVVEKGSIAVDGISLTPYGIEGNTFRVALIPTTLSATTLGQARAGDLVNLEADIAAKYAAQAARVEPPSGDEPGVTWELLRRAGFIS